MITPADIPHLKRVDFEDLPVNGSLVSGFAVLHCGQVHQLAIKMYNAIRELNAPFGGWQWVYLGADRRYDAFLLLVRLAIETGVLDVYDSAAPSGRRLD